MRLKRNNVLLTSISFILASVVLWISPSTSFNVEFAIFDLKLASILFAAYLCMDKKYETK